MEEFALIKSRVNLNRVNLGIALISDLKVAENHKSHYLASFLPVSMPGFWFSKPSRHPWR